MTLRQLISVSRGISEVERYFTYKLENTQILTETATEMMANIPPTFGACAMLSASWAGFLQDHYSIPAIVVAGDLEIRGTKVFKCKNNLPEASKSAKLIAGEWDGHCWIEIDGIIGDLSIFRTAYAISNPSILKDYIVSKYGLCRGAMICCSNKLPDGMQYIPKFVLKDSQINELIAGMEYLLKHST